MIKSMTGFSKSEANENEIKVTIELKSLNARYLEINCRIPKSISHKELEIREIIKSQLARGTVTVSVNIENENPDKNFNINGQMALAAFNNLKELNKMMKIKEPVTLNHVLTFSNYFNQKENSEDSELVWKLTKKCLINSVKELDKMRGREGTQITRDIQIRAKRIYSSLDRIEALGVNRVPEEREKLRQRIAQLFESDEMDENRIQMEIVMIANRLDISEECVRLRSHLKFYFEALKSKEPIGQKLNFLLQEMNREINTIGSKSDSAEISQIVISVKEELERIREQAQNIE